MRWLALLLLLIPFAIYLFRSPAPAQARDGTQGIVFQGVVTDQNGNPLANMSVDWTVMWDGCLYFVHPIKHNGDALPVSTSPFGGFSFQYISTTDTTGATLGALPYDVLNGIGTVTDVYDNAAHRYRTIVSGGTWSQHTLIFDPGEYYTLSTVVVK